MDIAPFHNDQERLILAALQERLPQHPHLASNLPGNSEILADMVCVALNRMAPRYIRHSVDLAFYQTDQERFESEQAAGQAVDYAIGFVQARNAMRARR